MKTVLASKIKTITKLILILSVFISAYSFSPLKSYADTIKFEYLTTYKLNAQTKNIEVSQEIGFRVDSNSYEIAKNTTWEFSIPVKRDPTTSPQIIEQIIPTIVVKNSSGQKISTRISKQAASISISVNISKSIRTYDKYTLTYSTPELFEEYGKIKNIYIPGLSKDSSFSNVDKRTGINYITSFNSRIVLPKAYGEPSLTSIKPKSSSSDSANLFLEYSQDQIIGKSVWIQYGKSQLFKFKLEQKVIPLSTTISDIEKKLGINNSEYSILLPASADYANQKVVFTKFDPEPVQITLTTAGNLQAKFIVSPDRSTPITVEGYLSVDNSKVNYSNPFDKSGTLAEVPAHLEYLTAPAKYWESSSPEIVKKAEEIKGTSQNVLDIVGKTYNFVIDNINYDDKAVYGVVRERKGALATLKGTSSVCMEYSDLFIALSRAQGIPARAAFGKGYDPNIPPTQQVGHQWAQVWIPKVGWITIDTTWGESGRSFVGYDLDHALWFVREQDPENPAEVQTLTHTELETLEPPNVSFDPVSNLDPSLELLDQQQILDKYAQKISNFRIGSFDVGKFLNEIPGLNIVIILLPALVLFVILSSFLSIYRKKKKEEEYDKAKLKKKTEQEIAEKKEQALFQEIINKSSQKEIRENATKNEYDLTDPFGTNPVDKKTQKLKTETEKYIEVKQSELEERKAKFNIGGSETVRKALEKVQTEQPKSGEEPKIG